MNQPTIREQLLTALCDPTESDADILGLPEHEAERLLDAYRDEELASEAGERWIRSQEDQLGIKWADFRAGRWEMDLAAGRDFAAAYVAAARALLGDAPNYSETKLMFDVKIAKLPETYTLVVQRHAPGALTPHEARQRAEAENARLRAELDEMVRLSHHYRTLAESAERRLGTSATTT
ncbi:hypothetical protein [Kitasatospora sp. NPDC005856]|uniref:hypothetical protein n=1 Tax=Kitasatospora sp. NPDC005856 TaxID=3154566 RepID=UPI0033E4ED5F